MRKKISQREAIRTRRELKRLREFVNQIRGSSAYNVSTDVCDLPDSSYTAQRLRDLAWGARSQVVFVARINSYNRVSISAARVPESKP